MSSAAARQHEHRTEDPTLRGFSPRLARLPKLALATEKPEYRQSLTLRGLKSLPVAF